MGALGGKDLALAVLLSTVKKEMDCPREVMIWNYFDHEHVVGTHYKHYSTVRVIDEMDTWALSERTRRLPVIRRNVTSMDFVYLKDPHHIRAYHFGRLARMQHDILFEDLGPEKCLVTNEYRLYVPCFLKWLEPLWRRITTRWFHVQWNEDVPMRLRRWKVWKLGFVDFVGLDYVNRGTARAAGAEPRPYPIKLPVPKATTIRTKGFPRLFAESEEVGYREGRE